MTGKKPFDHYKEHICKVWFDEKGYQTATEIVSDLIRCKDCKHWSCYGDETFCSELGIYDTNKESYCSYAKREQK